MTDRFPLIVNPISKRIEELVSGDNLDLSNNGLLTNGSTGISGQYLKSTGAGLIWDNPGDVYLTDTQTLTNKTFTSCTLSGSANSFFNIPNTALVNSSITVNGVAILLGDSVSTPDNNTTYSISAVDGSGATEKIIRLTSGGNFGSGVNDDVTFVAGDNVTLSRTDDAITINSSFVDTDTVTRLRGTASGSFVSGDVTFTATGSSTVSQVGNTINISSVDTNLVTSVNGTTGDITVQETLVSGTNIKTINGTAVLGSGDIVIAGGGGGGVELTDFSATTPIVYNNTTGAFSHATSGVSANTYGSASSSQVIVPRIAVNNTGHITSVTNQSYFPPTAIVTGINVNNTSYLASSVNGEIAFVAGDNVTLSASSFGPGGYPTLTISSTGGGGGSTDWYSAVNTTSPSTTLNKPAAYDGNDMMSTRLAIGGNDSSFPSGSSPTPGFWSSNPNPFGGNTYTESSSIDSSFTVSSGTPGLRWIIAANTTGYQFGSSFFNEISSSGSSVAQSELSVLPSPAPAGAEVHGVVVCDSGSVTVDTSPNCTVHETLSANNITYIFWSMTGAQTDNVFNGSPMLNLSTFTSFFVNYFFKYNN